MLGFICYFFPAVTAIWLYEVLTRRQLSVKRCVFRFCTNAVVINFLCLGIKCYILGTGSVPIIPQTDMFPQVAFNYLVMAIVISIVLVFAELLLVRKVSITVEEENEEDK